MKKFSIISIIIFLGSALLFSGIQNFPKIQNALAAKASSAQGPAAPDLNYRVWECYDDGTIDPCHNSLNAVEVLSGTSAWAVGNGGLILNWDGTTWTKVTSPTSLNLNALEMSSATDGWAVGESGTILHWDGGAWTSAASPTGSTLNDLSAVSNTNIWGVGNSGTIIHWDGISWSSVTSPVLNRTFYGISMVSATDGWISGSSGTLLHLEGGNWTSKTSGTTYALYDVSMLSATDGWIVGDRNIFWRWNGSTWTQAANSPFSSISSVYMVQAFGTNDAWVAGFDNGYTELYHFNGSTWNLITGNISIINYNEIEPIPGSVSMEAWVVGDVTTLIHWTGSVMNTINQGKWAEAGFRDLAFASPGNGWAAGCMFPFSQGRNANWDGSQWQTGGNDCSYSIDFVPGSNGSQAWAVGTFGDLRYWNGSTWTDVTSPVGADLLSVSMLSASEGWAVGGGYDLSAGSNQSVIIRYQGGAWNKVTNPTTNNLTGVAIVSASDGWAVGAAGTILHWNGSAWATFTSPVTKELNSIFMVSSTDGWAVGATGTILHWNGSAWSIVSSPTTQGLTNVTMYSAKKGWAVGYNGTILRWDGTNWSLVPSPTKNYLEAVAFADWNEVWIAGGSNLLRYREPPAALTINYTTGAAGSKFTLSGVDFPAESTVLVFVNGQQVGSLQTDINGGFTFLLDSTGAEDGFYLVTVSVNPSASVRFDLNAAEPVRDGSGEMVFTIPPNSAFHNSVQLPFIKR